MDENNNGNGGPVDPPGGPPPGGPQAPEITIEEIAKAALKVNPNASAVAVPTTAAGFSVQVIFWRKDLERD